MFDDIGFGFIRGIFKFWGWLIIDILLELYINPLIYSVGKYTIKVITLGQWQSDEPSEAMDYIIYATGSIILIACFLLICYWVLLLLPY